LDNLSVCDNVHTDHVSALAAVCTANCALQIVVFTLHHITYLLALWHCWLDDRKGIRFAKKSNFSYPQMFSFEGVWRHSL